MNHKDREEAIMFLTEYLLAYGTKKELDYLINLNPKTFTIKQVEKRCPIVRGLVNIVIPLTLFVQPRTVKDWMKWAILYLIFKTRNAERKREYLWDRDLTIERIYGEEL